MPSNPCRKNTGSVQDAAVYELVEQNKTIRVVVANVIGKPSSTDTVFLRCCQQPVVSQCRVAEQV